MATIASLRQPVLDVVCGQAAACPLSVRNTGKIVESYRFEVVGGPAAWATVEPAELSLYPGTDQDVQLVFTPPRLPTVPAGPQPYAVRIIPTEQPHEAVAVEGEAHVAPFTEMNAELVPHTSTGRRKGRHEVAVDNRGNVPIEVGLAGADPDGKLAITPAPNVLVVPPGQAMFSKLNVRARKRRWRGGPATHPFQAAVHREDEPPRLLDGSLVQRPVFPRSTGRWLAGLLALLVLLAALWMFLVKPAVESAATEALAEDMAALSEQVGAAKDEAAQAREQGEQAEELAGQVLEEIEGTTLEPAPPEPEFVATILRLDVTVGEGSTATDGHAPEDGTVFAVTDLILENPQGDAGLLEILIDDELVYRLSMANFRDLDHRFITPIEVAAGQEIILRATCETPGQQLVGTSTVACRPGVVLNGKTITLPDDET
jgi:hypothetical protein